MLIELIVIFITIVIICLILTVFLMHDLPILALPFVTVGMLFSVILTYNMFNVEYFYTAYNSTTGLVEPLVHSIENYGTPYSYIFFLLFWIFVAFFVYCGFRYWQIILEKQNENNKKGGL